MDWGVSRKDKSSLVAELLFLAVYAPVFSVLGLLPETPVTTTSGSSPLAPLAAAVSSAKAGAASIIESANAIGLKGVSELTVCKFFGSDAGLLRGKAEKAEKLDERDEQEFINKPGN
ncbi:hypothetical protein [Undibacterium sp. Tian12W]|uniref:hypothetical protein n=1 Tax=Undibacterium sp. Tian12W TaxID=3413054 RepID=UPI003BF2EFBC